MTASIPPSRRQNMGKPLMMSTPLLLATLVFLPIMGIVMHKLRGPQDAPPPLDFGHGGMFDRIATRYDLINRVLALKMDVGWRKRLAKEVLSKVEASGPIHILDVATGTADVALAMADAFQSKSFDIVGVDPSPNMLQVGRDKIQERKLQTKIQLFEGDARTLLEHPKVKPAAFDAVTMAFGIRNVPPGDDRRQALCNLRRSLKLNGILAIMEFSEPEPTNPLQIAAKYFIRYVVPFVGGILSGSPREYMHLQHSIAEFPAPSEFVSILEGLECESEDETTTSAFRMATDPAPIQLNFGSVQLYVARAVEN